jgi:hypothetical protein
MHHVWHCTECTMNAVSCDGTHTFILILYFSWKSTSSFSFARVCFSKVVATCRFALA